MNEKELIQFLKDNLEIELDTKNSKAFGCQGKYISAKIKLGDTLISSDEVYIK